MNSSQAAVETVALVSRTTVAPGVELRVMPLGDSITFGFKSSDGNGYRLRLEQDLSGSNLLYVGSVQSGNMADNFNEGHSGATINQISGFASNSLSDRPNVVLLHAGTNDMNNSPPTDPYSSAPDRLGALIDQIFAACPDAAILVAQIINAANADTEARIQTFNNAVPGVVAQRANAGHHVMVVDFRSVTVSDLQDGLHPSDQGYQKMGDIWFSGIQAAVANGWIHPPVGPDPAVTSSKGKQRCLAPPFWYSPNNGGPIASGVGHGGNALFKNDWVSIGQIASGIGLNATGVTFADLDGDGRDDYIWVNQTNGAVIAYLNRVGQTPANWLPVNSGQPIASGIGPGSGVFWGDINGDGKADYLYVNNDTGAIQAYVNGGASPGAPGGWLWIGPFGIASGVPNANQKTVIFADINGDNRIDYLVKGNNGELNAWLNIGSPGSHDITWVPQGQIASGLGTPNITLADLDGDGRDDYLIWDKDGGLTGYLNIRSATEGKPTWISQGPSKSIALGLGTSWELIRLADIYGTGKVDYCILNAKTGAVEVYANHGSADTSVTGDGVRFADLNGDGLDDYLFVDENGATTAYLNGGPQANANLGWIWTPQNGGNPVATGIGSTRAFVHFADIDGDGKADYLGVDPLSGAVTYYRNGGANPAAPNGWLWISEGQIATGIGEGSGVRFGDIDGDGRADYIWLSESGAATVYINKVGLIPQNWIALNSGNPVATGVGAYRRDIRFTDIDGDGKVDYVWVHPIDGSASVWTNVIGSNPANWIPLHPDPIATGVGYSGACIEFAYLEHTGRGSYVPVTPNTGAVAVWFNGCNDPAPSPSPSLTGGSLGTTTQPGTQPTGGSGIVSIDPSIWSSANPVIYCNPPCTFVLPPLTLSTATTISFPLFTTSLEVGWLTTKITTLPGGSVSTSTGYERTTETTTITIPPLTTSIINLWNINFTSFISQSSLYTITSSILPPVLTITDDINPLTEPGVTHPVGTRTIHPPPYPYTTNPPGPPPGGSSGRPVVTIKPGPPGPPCLSGCGIPCIFFCGGPCLICPDGPPGDFLDPNDPNPLGPKVTPTSRPQTSCTTSTVTDYFVSCSPVNPTSSSCTTTSSRLVSGCQVTATATTTEAGGACTPVNIDDDQGEDGDNSATTTRATLPAPTTPTPTPTPTPSGMPTHSPTPSPTPIPSPTSAPAPPSRFAIIGIRQIPVPSVGTQGAADVYWYVFDAASGSYTPNQNYNGCSNPLSQQLLKNPIPEYPASTLGPFSLTGPANCKYNGQSGTAVASLTCDNGVTIKCFAGDGNLAASTYQCTTSPNADVFGTRVYCPYTPS